MKILYTPLLFIFLLSPLITFSQNAYLDNTFGLNGEVTTSIGGLGATADGAALQQDGKIVVIATYNINGENGLGFITLRFNKDGILDKSFGNNGIDTSFSNSFSTAYSVTIQPDGKILVAGAIDIYVGENSYSNFALVRYNIDGSLDKTFGVSGKVTTAIGNTSSIAYSTVVMPNGEIVAAGTYYSDDLRETAIGLALYGSNGALFKKVQTVTGQSCYARSIDLLPNRELVVGGSGAYTTTSKAGFLLVKYDSLLNIDTTFGRKGFEVTPDGGGAYCLAIAPNGKFVEGGINYDNSVLNYEVVRYNSNGNIDRKFGKNGKVILAAKGEASLESILVQPDEKIVFTGIGSGSNSNYPYINTVRLDTNGELDSSFALNGVDTASNGTGMYAVHQPDGEIIVVGSYNGDAIAILRYETSGEDDKTFGKIGITTVLIPYASGVCNAAAIQQDGKIVTGGFAFDNDASQRLFALARFNSTGSMDTTFGFDGKVVSQLRGYDSYINAIALQSDNKILAVGPLFQIDNINSIGLVRYTPNGSLDSTFGSDGVASMNAKYLPIAVSSLAIQSDNKILIAGLYNSNLLIARYNSDGILDSSFAVDGIDTMKYGVYSSISSISILNNGQIIATGMGYNEKFEAFYILSRFNSDGTIDTTFGNNGIDTTSFSSYLPGIDPKGIKVIIQDDNRILIESQGFTNGQSYNLIFRCNSNGIVDSTFGLNGVDTTNMGSEVFYDTPTSFIVLQNGEIVVAGISNDDQFLLMQFSNNGILDSTFGIKGMLSTSFKNLSESEAAAICLQPDGKIVAAGTAGDSTGKYSYFALARYISNLILGVINFSSKANSTLIYPDPIHQSATLNYTLNENENITINLFDVNGKLVKTFIANQNQTKGNYTEQLNFDSHISAGNYFLVISNGKEKETVKIIKQ